MKLLWCVIGTSWLLAASPAEAGGVKAHVSCSTDESGPPVAKGAKVAADQNLWCGIVWDGKGEPAHGTNGAVIAIAKDAAGEHVSPPMDTEYIHSMQGKHWVPAAPFKHDRDFAACAKITVKGQLEREHKPIWTGATEIEIVCDRAK